MGPARSATRITTTGAMGPLTGAESCPLTRGEYRHALPPGASIPRP